MLNFEGGLKPTSIEYKDFVNVMFISYYFQHSSIGTDFTRLKKTNLSIGLSQNILKLKNIISIKVLQMNIKSLLMSTNFKIGIQYIIFCILYVGIAFLVAYNSWWRIDDGSVEFFIIVFSVMICWIGVGYLSTLISGKIVFKDIEKIGFISPFTLVFSGFLYEKKGLPIAKKFKNIFSAFAFPSLILFIFLFYQIVHFVEKNDLANYKIENQAKIEEISYYKGSKRAHVVFEFDKKKIKKVIYLVDTFKNKGDYEAIVFSSRNPYIVKSKAAFEKSLK